MKKVLIFGIGGWVVKYLCEYLLGHSHALASDDYFSGFISDGAARCEDKIFFVMFMPM